MGSPATSGSGSHWPTYVSRRARAEVSWLRQMLVSTFVSHASGTSIRPASAPCQRRYVSCTASSASLAEPSSR